MTDLPRALRPSDYVNGRPEPLDQLRPFIGGTIAEQRRVIAQRREQWAAQDAAETAERTAAFYAARDARGAEHARRTAR